MSRRIFASLLTTPEYLAGIAVLYYSLQQTQSQFSFVVFHTPNVSERVKPTLKYLQIESYEIEELKAESNVARLDSLPNWDNTYTKLRLFGASQFEKIVYLDADMLVLQNIDMLTVKPHLSAVNSGGMLPEFSNWTMFNAGLLVIEPNSKELERILSQIGQVRLNDQSDQALLQAVYADWPERRELHLDHRFNIFYSQLDAYCRDFGYILPDALPSSFGKKGVAVVHFIGQWKPWMDLPDPNQKALKYLRSLPCAARAVRLWTQTYQNMGKVYPDVHHLLSDATH